MVKWVIAGVAVFPIAFLAGHLFDLRDWQLWAVLGAAAWWRFVGPLSD